MTQQSRPAPAKGKPMFARALIERDASAPPAARRARFVASDESVDRYGDIIRASGWQLDNFRKNPVLLFSHQSRELPVGRVDPIAVEGTRLIAHAEFTPEGMNAFADTVWAMIDGGFVKAVSVGFMPLADPVPMFDADKRLSGFEFIAQELLELSVTSVPANPNALQLARSFPITDDERKVLFTQEPDRPDPAIAAQQRRNQLTLTRLRRVF